jgi:hypothetical protein
MNMDHLSNYVARQNITRFYDQLTSELDGKRRADLQRLLIEEEDRLGVSSEHLDEIERAIAKGEKRIQQQRTLVEVMGRNHRDATVAKSVLENLTQIQATFAQYRRTILDAIERNRL